MRMRLAVVLVVACALSSGCASRISKAMESWVGSHVSDLVASWGPPQRVFDDGRGGQVFVYVRSRRFVTPGEATTTMTGTAQTYGATTYGSAQARTVYTPAQVHGYDATRTFWIDASGRIYRWQWKGL